MDRITEENATITEVVTSQPEASTSEPPLVLHLRSNNPAPSVRWTTDTVDNEHLDKKKSKCCCIYKKKRDWNDSDSSDSDCETGHCRGHVDKHKKPEKDHDSEGPSNGADDHKNTA
uniref:E3 ubiquitin-protein ligase PPP1R11 n=1 Tax=Ditylenchus dipsaci TaxID=166011 RepID=A0A915E203_9BILA